MPRFAADCDGCWLGWMLIGMGADWMNADWNGCYLGWIMIEMGADWDSWLGCVQWFQVISINFKWF